MNLCEDRREQGGFLLTPQLIPALILMKVWSEGGSEPCDSVDVVLLLLEVVCALEGVLDEEVTVQSVVERLSSMDGASLATAFISFVEESARNLTSFMNLFDRVLTRLVTASPEDDENSKPPLIDMQPLNPVLGVFVSQCLSAYECLTFSQVMRLHKRWAHATTHTDTMAICLSKKVVQDKVKVHMEEQAYLPALMELILPTDREESAGAWEEKTERDLGSEALRVAVLHGHFGHKEEGTRAVREAIRIALHDNNTKLLQHCLAWLHRLEPYSGEDALSVLRRVTTTAQELHQPLLAGWGKLEESKELLKLGRDPQQVLQVASAGGSGDCVPVYGPKSDKLCHRGTALVTMAKIWEHYGFRHVSQLYSQLQGHMTSCVPPPTELEGRESCVLSVSITARGLLDAGRHREAKTLLQSAKRLLRPNGKSLKLLCQCVEEVGFDWSIQVGDVATARRHLTRLQSLDEHSSLLRSAILSAALENFTEAQRLSRQLLKSSSPQLKSRALELLAEVHCVTGRPALSLPPLMESLTLCSSHHLPPYNTQLWVAQAQLQLGSLHACTTLATECLLHFQTCGDIVRRGRAQFLLVQANLLTAHKQGGHLEKEEVMAVIPALESVVADFQTASATSHLHKAALLLVKVYEKAGCDEKIERMRDIALHTKHPIQHTFTTTTSTSTTSTH